MIWEKIVSRRVFLSEMFLSSFFFLSSFNVSKNSSTEHSEKRLVHLFKNQESAKIIGLEYLKIVPEENNRQQLLSLLSSTLESLPTATDPSKLRELLRTRRQEDFKEGRVIEVQKWLLSVTELRLCALVALQPPVLAHYFTRIFSFIRNQGEQYV